MSMPLIKSKVHWLCCRTLTKLPQLCSVDASSRISRLELSTPWTFFSLSKIWQAISPVWAECSRLQPKLWAVVWAQFLK